MKKIYHSKSTMKNQKKKKK